MLEAANTSLGVLTSSSIRCCSVRLFHEQYNQRQLQLAGMVDLLKIKRQARANGEEQGDGGQAHANGSADSVR